ncbi:hypothetical protein XELAEV_18046830mg [Xenopus laevis]|uniref:Uncharacterized protein n=1 Tax=Xenopus laevis TaxID=8355 RepID=A0A974BTT8_XENLA|nr:hypothetical protein XELAEV_18046830mg [Xenopus laevis]
MCCRSEHKLTAVSKCIYSPLGCSLPHYGERIRNKSLSCLIRQLTQNNPFYFSLYYTPAWTEKCEQNLRYTCKYESIVQSMLGTLTFERQNI